MAHLTKAVARKRLHEARVKIMKVQSKYGWGVVFTKAESNIMNQMMQDLAKLASKLK